MHNSAYKDLFAANRHRVTEFNELKTKINHETFKTSIHGVAVAVQHGGGSPRL